MTSNDFFMLMAPKCAIATLLINLVLVAIYCIRHRKNKKNIKSWAYGIAGFFGINVLIFFVTMFFGCFVVPATIVERTVTLQPEVITQTNIIEKENIIDVPSIMLPLSPEGTQAVVIDTTSTEIKSFMDGFYGENVYFFNNRQDSTFLIQTDGIQNYSGLDITQIEYHESESAVPLQLDELGFETIWLFSDLSHIELIPTNCKVILYVPYQLKTEEIAAIKANGDITIITIDVID